MIKARPLVAAEKLEILELLYRRLPNGKRLKPSTKALTYLFCDCAASLHWSVARIAETLGYSVRMVAYALQQLRTSGVLTAIRKRRQTSQRFICLQKVREIGASSVSLIKQKCASAVAALRAGFDLQRGARSNHRFKKMGVTEAVSHLKTASVSDLSPQFRALMQRR